MERLTRATVIPDITSESERARKSDQNYRLGYNAGYNAGSRGAVRLVERAMDDLMARLSRGHNGQE